MANWLAALGDMALTGSSMISRNREEARLAKEQDLDRQMKLANLALMQQQAERAQSQDLRAKAQEILTMAGPNAVLDETAAATVGEGGMGFRLAPQEAQLASKQFVPDALGNGVAQEASAGQQAGMRVVPTAAEQMSLDQNTERVGDRKRQQQYRAIIESPIFQQQPKHKQQAVWDAAGLKGQVPETFEEQKQVLDYEHELKLKEIGAQNDGRIQVAETQAQARADAAIAAAQAKAGTAGQSSPYSQERRIRIKQSIDELKGKVSQFTAGAGSLLAYLPSTDARNFQAELATLRANIAFSELTEMREASKTGGALGNVSNIELGLLESTLGALDPGQSPANLVRQFERIQGILDRWEEAKLKFGAAKTGPQPPPGNAGPPMATSHGGSSAAPASKYNIIKVEGQ